MAKILYGKPVREKMIEEMKERVASLGFSPCLAILQVGEREDSTAYIKQKQKFGEQIGVRVILRQWKPARQNRSGGDGNLPDDEAGMERLEEEIIKEIERLNNDKSVNGIIVQLPLPENLDTEKIINAISEKKDADGLRESEDSGESLLVTPATAGAVMALLDFYEIGVEGKNVAVIGRSRLAGGPIAKELEKRGARVQVCHKETQNNAEVCRASEILVVAAGQIGLVDKSFVNKNQVVVDVGINRIWVDDNPKLVGDVNFEEVEPIVKAISPVPGGVGPLTVACLFENLVQLCYNDSESF